MVKLRVRYLYGNEAGVLLGESRRASRLLNQTHSKLFFLFHLTIHRSVIMDTSRH